MSDNNKESSDRVNILQNITLEMPQKKGRITSSMYFFGEEPVFSDSDQEMEYSRIVFGSPPSNTTDERVIRKKCDAQVQCDLIDKLDETPIISLIRKCADLNENEANDFKELIEVCQKIVAKKLEIDGCNCISSTTSERRVHDQINYMSQEFLPSRNGKLFETIDVTENNPKPSTPCDGMVKDARKKHAIQYRKKTSIIRKSNRVSKPPKRKYSLQENVMEEKTKGRLWEKDGTKKQLQNENNDHSKLSRPVRNQKRNALQKNLMEGQKTKERLLEKEETEKRGRRTKLKQLQNENNTDHSEISKPERIKKINGNVTEIEENISNNSPLPRNSIKTLARAWMKPNRSFNLEETLRQQPEFYSLQHNTKVRRLYSPSQWLQSQDFLNICNDP